MAARAGIAPSSVHKIWAAHGLKPHLTKTFKLSRDPNFVAKVEEIVGLYLDPPDKALVLAVDEKSQIQALDRTQPGLPMKKGRCGTMTHDYKRNGTTTLFAALNMLDGTVIGECMPRHRHREFLRFLKTIDERTLPNLDLHLIVDNYATHKTPAVKRWLKRHSRFHLHFTPASGSWLNMVERFFAEITRNRIRRGVFKSVDELKQAIMAYLDNHNGHPKPYVWTKTAAEIFSKVARAKQAKNHNTSLTFRVFTPALTVKQVRDLRLPLISVEGNRCSSRGRGARYSRSTMTSSRRARHAPARPSARTSVLAEPRSGRRQP